MKRIIIPFFAAIAAMMSVSCDPIEKETKAISGIIKIDDSSIQDIELPNSYTVTLTNTATAEAVTAMSENGLAVFENLIPGLYKATATASISKDGYAYTLTGSESNASFLNDEDEVTLKIAAAKEAALIFKEIYYSGAPDQDKYYMRDQFYEIYNNSSQVVYADGVCIAETIYAKEDNSIIYQYDVPGKDSKDYVFTQLVWQIPGKGTDYPVKPGESIIIAQWGTDHIQVSEGNSKVNLKGAEFEAFCIEKEMWDGTTLTDEAAINMNMATDPQATMGRMPWFWLTPVSGSRYILFKPSNELRKDNYLAPTNSEETLKNVQEILIKDIIDGVQTISDESALKNLGLPAVIDAGAIWCRSAYSGESISRKIKETLENGRIVYQDTNNTTNDFEVNNEPQIRRNGAKVPSWNTWIAK